MKSWFSIIGLSILLCPVLLSACGSTGEVAEDAPRTGPTVADSKFAGQFAISAFTENEQTRELSVGYRVEFETEFGALTVTGPCNILFGSFSLESDGSASMTLPGATNKKCEPELKEEEVAVREALIQISKWTQITDGYRLTSEAELVSVSLLDLE